MVCQEWLLILRTGFLLFFPGIMDVESRIQQKCSRLLKIMIRKKFMVLTPDVYFVRIVTTRENKLRSTVVAWNYIRRILTSRSEYFCASKVTNFDHTFLIFEYVLRLQVPVANTVRMNVTHAFKYLTHIVPDFTHWDRRRLVFILVWLNHVFQVGRTEFEHHILHAFFVFGLWVVYVQQLHNIWAVLELVKHLKFSADVLTSFHCPLDGNSLASVTVHSFKHKS